MSSTTQFSVETKKPLQDTEVILLIILLSLQRGLHTQFASRYHSALREQATV